MCLEKRVDNVFKKKIFEGSSCIADKVLFYTRTILYKSSRILEFRIAAEGLELVESDGFEPAL